ncbi:MULTISPECIES: glutathione S-transferase family protein [Spongiibacter]|uniref:glutathione S-transferase family protein n=1 Tax=Spongiibacter TaxID=630749 RepID=UPI000C585A4D|nr:MULTISPECIES: glutathione S-transferase family protein [Spongiibacter]MAY38349.1 glutathione-dependent reductase [Spongiibacter sp.]|tara:strand:+ start:150 stop:1094 length:945 start_codon:yes stop_codon:yes gene_type:complete
MGLLVNGKWQDRWYDTESSDGKFERESAQFRHQIGDKDFPVEADRYHLYVSLACPWAHRTLIFRKLKKLESLISVSVVSPIMLEQGWSFEQNEGSSGDPLYGMTHLHELYTRDTADYTGRVTVPVLWDKKQQRIVNNESADIIRQFNTAFDGLTGDTQNFYPAALHSDIESINEQVYHGVNNGVYRCGFATTQAAYDEAYQQLFATLDALEARLSGQAFLAGEQVTEADWRLFTTLIRFDAVYHGHFKCNRQRLEDFPSLSNYLRQLYQWPGIAETVDFSHIKRHYYISHTMINPTQVVPDGPAIDYNRPHNRR